VADNLEDARYAVPAAPLEPAPAPEPAMRKPIVVWITQGFAVLFFVARSLSVQRTMTLMFDANFTALSVLRVVGFNLVALLLAVVAIILMQRRAKLGQWLGFLCVAQLPIVMISKLRIPSGTATLTGGVSGYLFGTTLVLAPLIWWLYLIGFSRKARAWFRWSGA
jgi:hypothetical protein